MAPTVFVCGATGTQGGALARQLRNINWTVHATVRNPTSHAAQSLEAAGVQLTQGDWDDAVALERAMANCNKLFLCTLPDFGDFDRERHHAENIVKAAKAAGITQVLVSTSLGVFTLEAGQQYITPDSFMARHLGSKMAVEKAVRDGGFQYWTSLRPAFLMANFLEPKVERYPEPRDKGTWTTAMTPETRLALIDHVDIAAYTIAAFQSPEKFHGRAIGLASEMLTVEETLTTLGQSAGCSLRAVFMTEQEIAENQKTSNVFTNSQVSMRYMSHYIDMDDMKSVIQPTRFGTFLKREKEGVQRTYA